jgi:hypothetical protein
LREGFRRVAGGGECTLSGTTAPPIEVTVCATAMLPTCAIAVALIV